MDLLLLLLLVTGGQSALTGGSSVTVVQHPPELYLSEGQTAWISCNISSTKEFQIVHHYWHMNGPKNALVNTSRITVTPLSLTISSVTPRDSGLYVCSFLDIMLDSYQGNGTHLLVTVTPAMTLREDTENHLLICQAERFYPPDLNISWRVQPEGNQTLEDLMENEDGTFTKTSRLTITEEMQGESVSCHLYHTMFNTTLHRHVSLTDPRIRLYQQLLPCRVLLVFILISGLASIMVYDRLQRRASKS
ncbi:uncharacterized protein [Aquarana catesbeiana]|uniref:uncharacterized protein n=1 Tax=Aquarana catesbeiana TaxID=8400 RepID=UPI003CC92805